MKKSDVDLRDAFFEEVYKIAQKDKNFIFVSDDMDAFGLRKFKRDFPKQFVNIGVAEQNLMDLAAGLATSGKKVFVFGICSYITLRCYEQIRFSICSMNLPVTICGVGAGYSFSFDGPTHHGVSDIAVMRALPEMSIYNPIDEASTRYCTKEAYKLKRPAYIRLDKGVFKKIYADKELTQGFSAIKKAGKVNIVTTGYMTRMVMELLEKNKLFGKFGLIDIYKLKPVPEDFIKKVLSKSKLIITVEENLRTGGLGSTLLEINSDLSFKTKVKRIASLDRQILNYGSREYLLKLNKMGSVNLTKILTNV